MRTALIALSAFVAAISIAGCAGGSSPSSSAVASAKLGTGQPSVAVGDVDGDGRNDIVFADKDGVKLIHNGVNRFAVPVVIGSTNVGTGQAGVAIGDVTGDGRPDVIVGDKNGVTVLMNYGNDQFAPWSH